MTIEGKAKKKDSVWKMLIFAYGAGAIMHEALYDTGPYWLPIVKRLLHLP